ncbi:P-loop containing nucleoside triphosphate hydrolase protein, partial [Rhizodiscina lignyota]
LSPPSIRAHAIKSQTWFNIRVAKISDPTWAKEALQHLVLAETTKSMLLGLVEKHKKNMQGGLSDVIPSKGKGLAVVLHGPPGVGKTLTAETMAEHAQKPLLPINVGELTAETNMIFRLRKIFETASRWDAVLLLDEADVLLEKRSYEDLRRNGVVSVFLRMLEYFEGIIFLTTNRIETMDVAFQSRIHIAIKYPHVTPEFRRRIWANFIERLDEREAQAKRELIEHLDDIQEWELNGRQIRNVLSIAESIA